MFNRKYIFLKGSVFQPAMLVDGSVYDWEQSSLLTLQLSTGFILQGLEYTAHIMCLVGGWTSHLTSLLTVYPSNWRHAICSALDESLFALLRTIVPRKLNTLKKKWKKNTLFSKIHTWIWAEKWMDQNPTFWIWWISLIPKVLASCAAVTMFPLIPTHDGSMGGLCVYLPIFHKHQPFESTFK